MTPWYLLYCKRAEQERAKAHLENQGVCCYYPQIEVERIRRGKKQRQQEPLFPGYVFASFDYKQGPSFTTVRSTRGVADFVRCGSKPIEVPMALIDSLQTLEGLEQKKCHSQLPKPGDKVNVLGGQFAGIEAIYQEPDGETRSIMLITLINQPVKVIVDNQNLSFPKD
ncbi:MULTISPECIES: transcription/translation regulatory transformer protein RfaH [unclassified Vibrio]|uniref:Transcription antitermination protein RfaH n=1 Tax=Vibrio sp. HB236076 TaxID=3232307 RepID=A0AB39HDP0_9VIBR|nr:transcription/translation regulatory transformer protein RfaH [Vibrio sp. HB161653]MDP5254293.1 transcription/translation regulatory transformer protein RfaH [Vibrio sp. HB161653]